MTSLKTYQQQIASEMENLLKDVLSNLPEHQSQLRQAMQYGLLNGGKRIRPFLVYAVGDMLNVSRTNLAMCAIAVECIHSYSLIHDDLPAMDDDDLRRGKPTSHIVYGEATAILAGDALQTLAFDVLANYPAPATVERIELVSLLAKSSGYAGMCGGQALDLAATDQTVPLSQLHQIHELKTGALINACVAMPCVFAQLSDSQRRALSDFSQALGLAFQVKDDILDITSDTATLGKPQGSDEKANKSTFPGLMGLQGTQDYLNELHAKALNALDTLPWNTDLLRAFSDYVVQREH